MNTYLFNKHLLLIFISLSVLFSVNVVFANESARYLDYLKSDDVDARIKAATELAKMHDIAGVRLALKDQDKRVRRAAIYNLSIYNPTNHDLRDPEAVDIFIRSLKDKEAEVRYAALFNLRDYETEAFFLHHDTDPDICREITALLSDPGEHVRYQAVNMVENCRAGETEEALFKLGHNKKEVPRIRQAAIMKLGSSRTKGIGDRIMPFLADGEEKYIRSAAVYSLGKLKYAKAVPEIIPYVYDSEVRDTAVIALGMIGDPRAGGALADVLITKDGKIGEFVLNSLSNASSPVAVPKLLKVKPLLKDAYSKAKFIEALAGSQSDDAVLPLLELFADKNFTTEQYLVAKGLERFESRFALNTTIEAAKKNPQNASLSSLSNRAKKKLEFPEESAREKQKQEEETAVQAKEQEINQTYATGMTLFREKKYEKALPYFNDAVDQFEKLYAKYPSHFRSSSNQIRTIRCTLAEYYLWKARDVKKAVTEYEKLISVLERYEQDKRALIPYVFALGEIYEKDMKDYARAFSAYSSVAKLSIVDKEGRDREMEIIGNWYLDWIAFLGEKISVRRLKRQKSFSRRTLKHPNFGYGLFMSFGYPSAGTLSSFDDDPYRVNGEGQVTKEIFDKVYARYPERYKMILFGATLFYEFIKENRYDDAEYIAGELMRFYPDDLNTIMLRFDLAELYKSQSNDKKYQETIAAGKRAAKSLNIEIILGPDERFATPEKTWQLFVESLKKGDVDKAIECFSPTSQQKYRQIFTSLKAQLPQIASAMGNIRRMKENHDGRAEYDILKKENGKEYSYGIYFVDVYGEWKIENF